MQVWQATKPRATPPSHASQSVQQGGWLETGSSGIICFCTPCSVGAIGKRALNSLCQPVGWMDAQLAALDGHAASPSNWSVGHDVGHGRDAGYERWLSAETVSQLCRQGQLVEAVDALEVLVHRDSPISESVFYRVLKECVAKKDLRLGRRVHGLSVKKGYESGTFLCNHILRMYASHGRLEEAMDVFARVVKPDAFTWSAMISAHVKHGQDRQAVELYRRMRRTSVKPDGHVFVAALQACARAADLKSGQEVHADVLGAGVERDLFVGSCLVDMYAKCGSLDAAQRVFDRLGRKSVVTWSCMIAGYSQQGMGQRALGLYRDMQEEGIVAADAVTFVCLLQACGSLGPPALDDGKRLHAQIRAQGLSEDVFVGSSLVNMYAKCGDVWNARSVFDGLAHKNVITWNAILAGYAQQGIGQEALVLFRALQEDSMAAPDAVTFVSVLQACAGVGKKALETGKQLHAQIRDRGLECDGFVANSLVNMYAKCGSLEDAQRVFDGVGQKSVVTWNAMIAGYSQQGMGWEALLLYRAMQEEGIVAPGSVTFVCLLQACASLGSPALEKGMQLHAQIREQGLQADVVVGSSLVNMYAKCGSLVHARGVFDRLVEKNVVTWSAMIAGYSQQGMGQEALHLYRSMQCQGIVELDSVTCVCLLQACASVAALQVGRQIHAQMEDAGLDAEAGVGNSLINMYAKSGSMVDAQQVFDVLPKRDVFTWSALIAGYTRQGDSKEVFELVHRMREHGMQPDGVTFLSVLTVCSHTGLVDKGREYFEGMSKQYGITPSTDHYTCMVDLLGRAGQVEEALALARTMPRQPDVAVWHTLLGSCQKWRNVAIGRQAFDEAVKLDRKDAAAYVLMSNIYTSSQMWEQAQELQARRRRIEAWKQPGQSWWTDVDGLVHSFSVVEKSNVKP